MKEAMEDPAFREGFNQELEAFGKQADATPGIFDQIDASLADQGSPGDNLQHYGERGALLGGLGGTALGALSLLSKGHFSRPLISGAQRAAIRSVIPGARVLGRGTINWSKVLPHMGRPFTWGLRGAVGGGLAGLGYGAKKTMDNMMFVDPNAIGPHQQYGGGMQPGVASGDAPVYDQYSPGGSSFTGTGSPVQGGGGGFLGGGHHAASELVRANQSQLAGIDHMIAQLQGQRGHGPGGSVGDYANVDSQIAELQRTRDNLQNHYNHTLAQLGQQQQIVGGAISRQMPRVDSYLDTQRRMAGAADQFQHGHGNDLLKHFVGWLGGNKDNDFNTYDYHRRADYAENLKQQMEDEQNNPSYYR